MHEVASHALAELRAAQPVLRLLASDDDGQQRR